MMQSVTAAVLLAVVGASASLVASTSSASAQIGQPTKPTAPPAAAPAPAPVPAPAPAPAAARGPDAPLEQDPRLVTGKLPNGLKYIITKTTNPPARGLIALQVNVGTLNESDKQRGAARFVQQMAFAGSTKYDAQAAAKLLTDVGSRPIPDALSHTTFEETVFQLATGRPTPETLGQAMSFLAEIPANLTFPEAEMEKTRNVLVEQSMAPIPVARRVQNEIWKKVSPGSLLGERLPDASGSVYTALTRQDLMDFYAEWYSPGNMTLVVVADADPAVVEEVMRNSFAAVAAKPSPAAPDAGMRPIPSAFAFVAPDPEIPQPEFYMFRIQPPHPPTHTEGRLRAKLVDAMTVSAFNRRLGEKISRGKVAFVGGSALAVDIANASTLIGVNASCSESGWKKTVESVAAETQRMRLHGFSAEDLEAVRAQYLVAAEQGAKADATRSIPDAARNILASVNNGDQVLSAEQTFLALQRLLPTITPEEVGARCKAMFDPASAAYVLVGGVAAEAPPSDDLLAAARLAFEAAPPADAPDARTGELMPNPPAPGVIVSEVEDPATHILSWTYKNGVLVHYLNLPTNKGETLVTISIAGGVIQETAENRGLTQAASVAWTTPASSEFSSTTLRELLRDKDVQIRGEAGFDNIMLGVAGKNADIETGLKAAHLLLTSPFIEPPAFDRWRRTQIEDLAKRAQDANAVFNDAVFDAIFPASEVRIRPITRERLDRLKLADAAVWLGDLIAKGPIEVTFVGDMPKEEAQRLMSTYLGSLPARPVISSGLYADKRVVTKPAEPAQIERALPSVTQTSYLLTGFFAADETAGADRRALLCARSILEQRLNRLLKEQEHLAPGVQVQYDPGVEFPGMGVFRAVIPVPPDKVDYVMQKVRESFTSFAEAGPTPEELDAARKAAIAQVDGVASNPNYWTGQLSLMTYRGKTGAMLAGERPGYEALTPADVKQTFAKYYKPDGLMRVLLRSAPPAALLPAVPPAK